MSGPETAAQPSVLVTEGDGVGRICFNEPARLNSLTPEMLDEATATITRWGGDPGIRVIVLTGAGRGFCAGATLGTDDSGRATVNPGTLYAAGRCVRAIMAAPKPVVSLVNGIAAGVGVSLAIAADYAVVSEDAAFMLAFAKIGLLPDGGATALVAAHIGRARAMRMALTAEKVSARTAYDWGLVAECVPADDFGTRGEQVVGEFARAATVSLAETKAALNAATVDLEAALALEEPAQVRLIGTADAAEGIAAFVAKRPADFTGR